jgi:hypothetical protein
LSICNSAASLIARSATHTSRNSGSAREIEAAGVKEVIVFHSSPQSVRSYQKDVPFLMGGDPEKALL